jgi:hypothetical protein
MCVHVLSQNKQKQNTVDSYMNLYLLNITQFYTSVSPGNRNSNILHNTAHFHTSQAIHRLQESL